MKNTDLPTQVLGYNKLKFSYYARDFQQSGQSYISGEGQHTKKCFLLRPINTNKYRYMYVHPFYTRSLPIVLTSHLLFHIPHKCVKYSHLIKVTHKTCPFGFSNSYKSCKTATQVHL